MNPQPPSLSPQPLVLIGAGGHAREVLEIIHDLNAAAPQPRWQVLGLLVEPGHEPTPVPEGQTGPGIPLPPILGHPDWLLQNPHVAAIMAIGQPAVRRRLVQSLEAQALPPSQPQPQVQSHPQPPIHWATLVHPSAWCARDVRIGPGSVVFPGARLSTGVQLGCHTIVNQGCNLSHDTRLDPFSQLGPGCTLAGGVWVESGADVGAGVSARPRARIGQGAVVGAGAAIVADIPAAQRFAGVPARSLQGRGHS